MIFLSRPLSVNTDTVQYYTKKHFIALLVLVNLLFIVLD